MNNDNTSTIDGQGNAIVAGDVVRGRKYYRNLWRGEWYDEYVGTVLNVEGEPLLLSHNRFVAVADFNEVEVL